MFKCNICGKSFKNQAGLNGHYQWKHPEVFGQKEPQRLIANAPGEREENYGSLPSDRDYYPDPYRSVKQPQQQKSQAEQMREQNEIWEEELKKQRLTDQFNKLERNRHNEFMDRFKPEPQQETQPSIERDPQIEIVKKQQDKLKEKMENMERAINDKNLALDTTFKNLAKVDQENIDYKIKIEDLGKDKEIRELKEEHEEEMRKEKRRYARLEDEAIEMSAELYDTDQGDNEDDDTEE